VNFQVKYLVSGATGFVGRELCRQLVVRDCPFIALSQHGAKLPDGTSTIAIDLEKKSVSTGHLKGVDVVFHLAGIAHQQAKASSYTQVNHLATVALAKTAAAAGVKCFVYLSSVKAMGPSIGEDVRTEGECALPVSAYGMSKLQAEEALREAFAHSEMSVVILRPALVYGADIKGNLQSLRRAVRAGMPRPPEVGGRSMVAVQDLVELMLLIAADPPDEVRTWIVCDGCRYSSRRIYELFRSADGKGKGMSWLPLWGWKLAAYLADGLYSRGADSTYLKLFGTELYSSAALLRDMPWKPQLQLSDLASEMMSTSKKSVR
jgi:nucleoside-diphosphate-sugar epimerase